MILCSVHVYSQSQPMIHHNVENTYQKGDLFCILLKDGSVMKYPLQHIFRIHEVECTELESK